MNENRIIVLYELVRDFTLFIGNCTIAVIDWYLGFDELITF